MLAKLENILKIETERSSKMFSNYFITVNIIFLLISLYFSLIGDKLYMLHAQIDFLILVLFLIPLRYLSKKVDNPLLFKYIYFGLYIFYMFTLVFINNRVDTFSLILLLSINIFGLIYMSQTLYLVSTVSIAFATMIFSYSSMLYATQENIIAVALYRTVIVIAISLGGYIGLMRILELMNSLLSDSNSPFMDPLTGAYNKYYLRQRLSHIPVGGDIQLSIIAMGIDNMREINTKYGFSAGDSVLQEFTALIKQATRNTDAVCRNEGDRFAIIVQHPKEFKAENLAQRIKQQMEKEKFNVVDKDNEKAQIKVSSSFGVVSLKDGENSDKLLERGERALMEAKKNGKNRIEKGE